MKGNLGERGEESIGPEMVHEFWFADATAENHRLDEAMVGWFRATPDFDRLIRSRLLHRSGAPRLADTTPGANRRAGACPSSFCSINFRAMRFAERPKHSRPMKRRARSSRRVALGNDIVLTPVERHFFYLPLLHSEKLADQELSVMCFEQLQRQAPANQADYFQAVVDAATRYHSVIERFGRFHIVTSHLVAPPVLRRLSLCPIRPCAGRTDLEPDSRDNEFNPDLTDKLAAATFCRRTPSSKAAHSGYTGRIECGLDVAPLLVVHPKKTSAWTELIECILCTPRPTSGEL